MWVKLGERQPGGGQRRFYQNYCTSAANSFITIGDTFSCIGVGEIPGPVPPTATPTPDAHLHPIPNPIAAKMMPGYFPDIPGGGSRLATRCPSGLANPADCADAIKVPTCAGQQKSVNGDASGKGNCMVTVLDHYTTSFNYSELNIGAIGSGRNGICSSTAPSLTSLAAA